MKIRYSSNNSGGHWRLSDNHWLALEKAGWTVNWCKNGSRLFCDANGRFLGTLATSASKDFGGDVRAAGDVRATGDVRAACNAARTDFEAITLLDTSDRGCECCGEPHNFLPEYE